MTTSSTPSQLQLLGPDIEQARYDRGAKVLAAVDGVGGQRVVDALADIAPSLAHHVVAYGFGEVYARPGLTHAQRQLVTLGMLTALGDCEPQLEVHVNASLNVGLTPSEIVEAITTPRSTAAFPRPSTPSSSPSASSPNATSCPLPPQPPEQTALGSRSVCETRSGRGAPSEGPSDLGDGLVS